MNRLFLIMAMIMTLGGGCLTAEEGKPAGSHNSGLNQNQSPRAASLKAANGQTNSADSGWKFDLKMPALKKQSAVNWVKTGAIAGGALAAGAVAMIVIQPSDDRPASKKLPGVPDWPE